MKRKLPFLVVFSLAIIIIPITVWAVTTGRFEIRKKAATSLPTPTYNNTFYILPICDGVAEHPDWFGFNSSQEVISDLKDKLGSGPYAKSGFSEVYRYMTEIHGEDQDYRINPSHLDKILQLAIDTNTPFLIHLNGFQWGGCGPLMQILTQKPENVMWDQNNQPWLGCQDGDINLSLNKYNTEFRRYKKRNLQDAVRKIVEFHNGPHGHLLTGVSIDSEIAMNSQTAAQQGKRFDYNPKMLRQYEEKTGIDKKPRPDDPHWVEFNINVIDETVEEIVTWVYEMGLPKEKIYTHQIGFDLGDSVGNQIYNAPLMTAQAKDGSLGVTTYGSKTLDANLFQQIKQIDSNWGIFEHNPLSSDPQKNYKALKLAYENGAHIITPYHWTKPPWLSQFPHAIRDTAFSNAITQFIRDKKNTPRPSSTNPIPTTITPIPDFPNLACANFKILPEEQAFPVGGYIGRIEFQTENAGSGKRDYWWIRTNSAGDPIDSDWSQIVSTNTDSYSAFPVPSDPGHYLISVNVLSPDCQYVCSTNGRLYRVPDDWAQTCETRAWRPVDRLVDVGPCTNACSGSIEVIESAIATPGPPSPPTNLQARCSNDQNRVTLSWQPALNANRYPLRVNNLSTGGWNNQCNSSEGDFCQDVDTDSYTFDVRACEDYQWWLHTFDNQGQWSQATAGANFNCCPEIVTTPTTIPTPVPTTTPISTPTPTPSPTPTSSPLPTKPPQATPTLPPIETTSTPEPTKPPISLTETPPAFCQTCPTDRLAKSTGNANCDGFINLADFNQWLLIYQRLIADELVPEAEKAMVDFNCSEQDKTHTINLSDFNIWLRNYQ